jgi:hypothetical protein
MLTSLPSPPPYVTDLELTVDEAAVALALLPESVVTWRPSPTAWSVKEIIGHLIDSATNNHQRFVRAGSQSDLIFGGYLQDEWVRVQAYDRAPWHELLSLWRSYNRHLARVMAAVPPEVRTRSHAQHNLHEIGWKPFSANVPATLDDLMADYVGHLRHHLAQVHDRVRGATAAGVQGHRGD